MVDFRAATAEHWRQAVINGDVSCVELTTTAITAAATLTRLGAFAEVDPDLALARASQMDSSLQTLRRSASPAAISAAAPLLGLPVGFKDLIPVAGMPLRLGSAEVAPRVPARDAPLAHRVHAAGAVSIGKTQVPEFGLPCYTENRIAPAARNPLDPSRTPGGSSGGAAAAVAAGILPVAPGNDGGGSVRIPAAACGLVGLKPGRGRLPDDDASSSVTNLMTSGPIAVLAEDAALLFDVMAGHRFTSAAAEDLAAAGALRTVQSALSEGLPALQIGVTTESPFSPELDIVLAEDAIVAVEEGITRLAAEGHHVQGTSHCTGTERFWPENYYEQFTALWTSRLGRVPVEDPEDLEPLTRWFLELTAARDTEQTEQALEQLQQFADAGEAILGPWDVLLTPMLGFAPPQVGFFAGLSPEENYRAQCQFTPYSSVVNVLGLPAINVPVHTDASGLSWSIQLIGRQHSEELLLALAAQMMRSAA